MDDSIDDRRLLTAELLSIGSELTVGETRDTNAGELARTLTERGVTVGRMTALPDRLAVVTDAFRDALARVDLVVSTGGLGPTPDDLTREAIAAAVGEDPVVDPDLEAWLRTLWKRRGIPFPELNLKQAWRIPSAEALPNPNGTAPGWFVRRPDGRIIVALPGPPREMRPMWTDEVLPRLEGRGLGADVATRTYRLTGIGESQVADLLGEPLLRASNPIVATYARVEAVDVRISAIGDDQAAAAALVEEADRIVQERLGAYVWATGETTWSDAIGERLAALRWTLAVDEVGTAGQVARLIGDVPWLLAGRVEAPARTRLGSRSATALLDRARRIREDAAADVGLAVHATPRRGDLAVSIAVATPSGVSRQRRLVFLDGPVGRSRAALVTAAVLLEAVRAGEISDGKPAQGPRRR